MSQLSRLVSLLSALGAGSKKQDDWEPQGVIFTESIDRPTYYVAYWFPTNEAARDFYENAKSLGKAVLRVFYDVNLDTYQDWATSHGLEVVDLPKVHPLHAIAGLQVKMSSVVPMNPAQDPFRNGHFDEVDAQQEAEEKRLFEEFLQAQQAQAEAERGFPYASREEYLQDTNCGEATCPFHGHLNPDGCSEGCDCEEEEEEAQAPVQEDDSCEHSHGSGI